MLFIIPQFAQAEICQPLTFDQVVCYGYEFYFGQGIQMCVPGTSHHGDPMEIIDMGQTHVSAEVRVLLCLRILIPRHIETIWLR